MAKNYRILAFLMLVLILETATASESGSTGSDVDSALASESKPDVIIKLIKRGAVIKRSTSSEPSASENSEDEIPREKRRSSSKKNKGRKVGK